MKRIEKGAVASGGIAAAPAYLYQKPALEPDQRTIAEGMEQLELNRFDRALSAVTEDLKQLEGKDELFAAHLTLAQDPMLQESVEGKIRHERKNAQLAVSEAVREYASLFDEMDDAYMRDRAEDVRDIGSRLLAALKGVRLPDLGKLEKPCIVIADELYPSDTVKMNPSMVKGILTEEGGVTSHVSIIAKNLGIPMIIGVEDPFRTISEGDFVCMDADADAGTVDIVISPDEETLQAYQEKQDKQAEKRRRLADLRGTPTVTSSGKRIFLCINVGSIREIEKALPVQIHGVGLFRTEFLYMQGSSFPTEEEQFAVYKKAASLMPHALTIRTLDIGGEKQLPYFKIEPEDNPSLGWRGIRISLDQKEMFRTQIRAILRASAFGNVRILFPMITSPEEFREVKTIVTECKEELRAKRISFQESIELGIMIETPASVLLAEEFAKEADFFSIGTNDLTQYLLAVDRGNDKVAQRYDYFHPAVVKAISQVIAAGHRVGIRVGMCGEMAGDPKATDLLLDLGLDEFSMSAGSVDAVRAKILQR